MPSKLRYILRKQFWGVLFILTLVVSVLALSSLNRSVSRNVEEIHKQWSVFNNEQPKKSDLIRALYQELGYGGAVHNFHNFIIRGKDFYWVNASEKLEEALNIVSQYKDYPITAEETHALEQLNIKLASFGEALKHLNPQGLPVVKKNIIDTAPPLSSALADIQVLEQFAEDNESQPTRSVLLKSMLSSMGLGGMIDQFKETVLGDSKTEAAFLNSLEGIGQTLALYSRLDLNKQEKESLAKIRATVQTYEQNYAFIQDGLANNLTTAEIDKQVFVDDSQAFAALANLRHNITLQQIQQAQKVGSSIDMAIEANHQNLYGLIILGSLVFFTATIALRDRIIAERHLRESESQAKQYAARLFDLKKVIDDHAIISQTDAEGHITYVNKKFCTASGYSREELLGQDHKLLNSGHHHRQFFQDLWRTISQGKKWYGEIKNTAKDGSHYWVQSTIAPEFDATGHITGYTSVRTDITQQKRQQEFQELKTLAAIEESQLKSNVFASLSHDLKTPLNAIIGFSEVLKNDPSDMEKHREYIPLIHQSGLTLMRLVNDIMDMSKIEAGRYKLAPSTIYPKELLTPVIHILAQMAAQHDVKIDFNFDNRIDTLIVDPQALEQICTNLVANAIKHSPAHSTVHITGNINLKGEFVLSVRDSGKGFTETALKNLGKPYSSDTRHQAQREKGTGLGLYISSLYSELHGGKLTAMNMPGGGARVEVILPRSVVSQTEQTFSATI